MQEGRFQILSLDGGGVKALFTANVLADLEEDAGVSVRDCFDMIVGTSAGGIVALGLGARLRPAEIVEHYRDLNAKVFPTRRRLNYARRIVRATYSNAALRQALEGVLGQRTLGDSDKRLVIPAYDVAHGAVHVFKTPHHPRLRRDWRVPMVDVALATSAAPTYFPAAAVDRLRLVDGGLWANNPSVVAIAEAVSMLNMPLNAIRVLNIGTTTPIDKHRTRLDAGGWAQWGKPAAETMLRAQSCGTAGAAEHLIGRERYVRFDARVAGGVYDLDRADPQSLTALASSHSRKSTETFCQVFADHSAPAFVPIYPTDSEGGCP